MRQNTEMVLMLFFPLNVMHALVELFIAQLFFPETTDMLPEYKFMLVIYLIGLKFRPWQTGRSDSIIDSQLSGIWCDHSVKELMYFLISHLMVQKLTEKYTI